MAGIFFYLYNRTVLSMGEYHEKLVLTQNVALALKISESIEDIQGKAESKRELMLALVNDINRHLTGAPAS